MQKEVMRRARRTFRTVPSRVILLLAMSLPGLFSPAPVGAQITTDECLWCHGQESIANMTQRELLAMVRIEDSEPLPLSPEAIRALYVPPDLFLSSAHSDLRCVDCHRGATQIPHAQRLPVVACRDCHPEVADAVARSVHQTGDVPDGRHRPDCRECHGPAHGIESIVRPRNHDWAVNITTICIQCHDGSEDGQESPAQTYEENVHGHALYGKGIAATATCTDCHSAHRILPPSDPESSLHPLRVVETCGTCHEGVADVYFTSVHGKQLLSGNPDAATCTRCHSSHGIGAVGGEFFDSVVHECSDCHLELGKTYLTSYHGKATTLGDHSVAVCSSCHGAHDILPRDDPASKVAPSNLVTTCGKCHEGANANFVQYISHMNYLDRENHPEVYYTWLVMTTLLLSVLLLFVPHSLLWFFREGMNWIRRPFQAHHRRSNERYIQRFHPVHRWTHFLIVVSFMGLVATGFPLKYSYAPWARNLCDAFGGVHVMGIIHRLLAMLTFTYAGVHLCYLVYFFVRKRRKKRIRFLFGPDSMFFSFRDLKDLFGMLRWFFFLGPKPRFDRWTYFEKFDYFGEIWGIIVIGGTGLILWLPTLFTTWLPGWILNCAVVVHSIEALLAASVIFLVHFLNTHLRPDKFPVDMVMFTGQMSETEMKEERGAEYERLVASGELEERVVPKSPVWWRLLGRVGGIVAYVAGLSLIALALKTEIRIILGWFE